MADPFDLLLDSVLADLKRRQSAGARFVNVSPEALAALQSPLTTPPTGVAEPPPAARPDPSKEEAFEVLRKQVMICQKCPHLVTSRTQVVFGVGNIHAKLMFIGEAPGSDEDRQGEPFVGKAGQLLTKIIQTMGLQRNQVYIGNVLKCRPDTPGQSYGNRKPSPEEMDTCLPFLHRQIGLIGPEAIVALGGTALEGLLGRPAPITKLRGKWIDVEGVPVMPTYHPSYLLRNQALPIKRQLWEDILQVMDRLAMPISDKQRRFFLQ